MSCFLSLVIFFLSCHVMFSMCYVMSCYVSCEFMLELYFDLMTLGWDIEESINKFRKQSQICVFFKRWHPLVVITIDNTLMDHGSFQCIHYEKSMHWLVVNSVLSLFKFLVVSLGHYSHCTLTDLGSLQCITVIL
jgi:hypothetical protein